MDRYITEFRSKIANKKLKIAVVGLGYVGLPLAIEFAGKGFYVIGVDLDNDRVRRLRKTSSYITDVTDKEIRKVISAKKFFPSTDFTDLKQADVIFICVPTPLKRKFEPNISYITQAVKTISCNRKHKALIILESTTYPGTTEEVILPMLEEDGSRHGEDFYLSFSPERIDPGSNFALRKIPKVVGGITPEAATFTAYVYSTIIDNVVKVSSTRVAEMVKLLENTFRLINIGLIDEMAMMANKMGIDIVEVINAAKTKPFGFMPFYPGPGVGGHCIPKDPLYLYWKAKRYGFNSRFIKIASDIIRYMPEYVVNRVESILRKSGRKLNKSSVLVVGVTYKKDVKDLRQSPSLDIIEILRKRKVRVAYSDPLIPYLKLDTINLKSVKLVKNNIEKYDCIVIATDHTEINYDLLRKNGRLIFDTRSVYKGLVGKNIEKL